MSWIGLGSARAFIIYWVAREQGRVLYFELVAQFIFIVKYVSLLVVVDARLRGILWQFGAVACCMLLAGDPPAP